MFSELDGLHNSNPKAYMDLVRSLRDGSFDKKVSDSTSHISPEKWHDHFQGLLGPSIVQSPAEDEMRAYVEKNCDTAKSSLDLPFSRQELLSAISSLKNNKAISFDQVSNEMLKTSKLVITKQLLFLFNSILSSTMYPTEWKQNILTPFHKSAELTDPSNFRGVAVSSCLGKLFNKMLQQRLENKCVNEGIISNIQGSGKKSSRTSDHLLVIRSLVDKYVTLGGKKLYACFFDIRRAFDCVPRNHLFYTLLKDYKIGGKFLKVLKEIYSENQIYIKLTNGLCEPFKTTTGVLQGEANSSLLFNIFVNKISEIFDQSCEPVQINKTDLSCLLWSDDLFVTSQSAAGLQIAIDKVAIFYSFLGLQLNVKKTKILIFNKAGRVLQDHKFFLAGSQLEVADCYQYLGIKLRPSGSLSFAAEELSKKARKAWYSISNVIYKDKRMSVTRAFQLFDSLVSPVALYGCEFWLPHVLTNKSFNGQANLLSSWESLKCETINQQCSRMLLSVHKKASRLAVLGDLGRYPLAVKAMAQTFNYKLSLASKPANTPIGLALAEMQVMAQQGTDCWLTRTNKMSELLKLPKIHYGKLSGRHTLKLVQSRFDRYWLDEISSTRVGRDGAEHNKLLTYSSFKGFFGTEPFVALVNNRNQRCHLSRLRVSAHRLGIEVLRYKRPKVARDQRFCAYCPPVPGPAGQAAVRPVDDELHCMTECIVGRVERIALYNSIGSRNSKFTNSSNVEQFKMLVCPTNHYETKLVSRFLQKQFSDREKLDRGDNGVLAL